MLLCNLVTDVLTPFKYLRKNVQLVVAECNLHAIK